ncbi:MAG: cytochrome c [Myxococcota bacterium]
MGLAIALITGCVGAPSSPGVDTGPPPSDTGKPDTGKPDTGNPDTGTAGNAAKGKVVYETYCIACHGPEGRGGSGLASSLRVNPSPVDQSDAVLVKVIRQGVTGPNGQMPGWADVIDEQSAADTIAYLRLSFGTKTENR